MRRGACLLIALLLAAATIESAAAAAGSQIRGIPVLEKAVLGPGTKLVDGVSVVNGSYLLGTPFATQEVRAGSDGAPIETRRWQAVLLVTGNPQDVIAGYQEQLEAAGIQLEVSCLVGSRKSGTNGTMECDGLALAERSSLDLTFTRSRRSPLSSHLVLRYNERVGGPVIPALPDLTRPTTEEAIKLPREWPPLPSTGDRFGLKDRVALRLVRGSALVAPVGTLVCGSGGFVAVLRVTGDPRKVINRYAEQFVERGWSGEVTELQNDDATILRVGSDESGAGLLAAESIVRDGSPTYLRVESCLD